MKVGSILALLTFSGANAFAHTGEPIGPQDLWKAWSVEPGIVIPLALMAALFAIGARQPRAVSPMQKACFWGGWTVLTLALISPLHSLGEVLFSAHMAQHEFLILVAAPLLVLGRPLAPLLKGIPMPWRKKLGQWSRRPRARQAWLALTAPSVAWSIHAVALWLWHAPGLFEATLSSDWIHSAQHASFLCSALLFWWSLLHGRGRANYGAAVLYIFTTAVHTSILGALLTFARDVWYPAYSATTKAWGFSPLEDQQIGGLIMWIPAGLVYLAAGLALLGLWLRESDVVANRRRYAQ
jgi:putative membrane protein